MSVRAGGMDTASLTNLNGSSHPEVDWFSVDAFCLGSVAIERAIVAHAVPAAGID